MQIYDLLASGDLYSCRAHLARYGGDVNSHAVECRSLTERVESNEKRGEKDLDLECFNYRLKEASRSGSIGDGSDKLAWGSGGKGDFLSHIARFSDHANRNNLAGLISATRIA